MTRRPWMISRRTMLRGAGAVLGLPLLEAMGPDVARAARAGRPPVRMACLFVPNGKMMEQWTPAQEGRLGDLPASLAPLEPVKKDLLVLSELALLKTNYPGESGNAHSVKTGSFLTCQPCKKSENLFVGPSVDQVAAKRLGSQTYLDSLNLGIEAVSRVGGCGKANEYNCAYQTNVSWRDASTPSGREVNPRVVFEQMFRGRPPRLPRWDRRGEEKSKTVKQTEGPTSYRKSILDLVREDADALKKELGVEDRRKLDEFLYSVRSVEKRIAFAARARHDHNDIQDDLKAKGSRRSRLLPVKLPEDRGVPKDFTEHVRLMADLMVLAFQTDTTRVATLMYANGASDRIYHEIGVKVFHHLTTHHGKNPAKTSVVQKINQYHVEQYAYLLQRMASIREGDSTLLDNSMVLYGSGISDGDRHNSDNLPILLGGRGGGSLVPGRHVKFNPRTPLANLYVEMLARVGAPVKSFGESTGGLKGLK